MFIMLPEIMRLFHAKLPEVGLIVQEMTTTEQEAALRSGQIEAGIMHPPLDDGTLRCTAVAEIPFKLVLSDQNPLARQEILRIDDLAEQHFITFPRRIGPRLYDAILGMCQTAGFSPQIILEASPAQSIIALPRLGSGWDGSRPKRSNSPGRAPCTAA